LGIPLRSGRAFTEADDTGTANVAIINERLRKQLWPDVDPVGQQLVIGDAHTVVSIVGVVGDVKMDRMSEKPRRELYLSFAQVPPRSAGFVIRSSGNDETLAAAMRDAIWSVDSQQPVSKVSRIDSLMADVLAPDLILSQLAGFFGLLAVFLGAIGIYGVMANSVAQRTSEIGIRMALGASPKQLVTLVVGEGLKLAIIGIVAGVLVALALTRSMASILYNVKTSDPLIFTAVAIFFAFVAVLACGIPAWRALRVDPTIALRYE
jgi:predicted permease